MKISAKHVSLVSAGGAWLAAERIVQSQNLVGIDATLQSLTDAKLTFIQRGVRKLDYEIQRSSNQAMTTSLFRSYGLGKDVFKESATKSHQNLEVVNLHWIPGRISAPINDIFRNNVVFWNLHDMNPMTGFCHHAFDCDGFKASCNACPQVLPILQKVVTKSHKQKVSFIDSAKKFSVIAPSKWIVRKAEMSTVFRNKEIFHIPNPVDTDIFMPVDLTNYSFRSNRSKSLRIGILGSNYDETKNATLCFEIIKEVQAKTNTSITAVIIGDPYEKNQIEQDVQTPPGSGVEQIAKILQSCDLFLYLSTADTFPSICIEAQACGIPVITWKIGGQPETIVHEESGFVADAQKSDVIKYLMVLLENSEVRHQMSISARGNAVKNFSLEVVGQKYFQAYLKNSKL